MDLTLVIGNKRFSSWSLRPWLLLQQAGIPFREVLTPLYQPDSRGNIAQYSPSGRVPVLIHGTTKVWESLAIAEYVNELYPDRQLWPEDREDRALARCLSAEMHAGFAGMRQQLSMNIAERFPLPNLTSETQSDVNRVATLVKDCLERSRGPFLFGNFCIADAMYAPVMTRLLTYSVPVGPVLQNYMDAVLGLPAMQAWMQAAQEEKLESAYFSRQPSPRAKDSPAI